MLPCYTVEVTCQYDPRYTGHRCVHYVIWENHVGGPLAFEDALHRGPGGFQLQELPDVLRFLADWAERGAKIGKIEINPVSR